MQKINYPVPECDARSIDAMIHHLLIGRPLMMHRGPFHGGLPVPGYATDEGAAFTLARSLLEGLVLRLDARGDTTHCRLEARGESGTPHSLEGSIEGDRPALLISLMCLDMVRLGAASGHSLPSEWDARTAMAALEADQWDFGRNAP